MTVKPSPVVGANAERARTHNRQMVLGQVRAAGQVGRAEVARASGLSTQAVSNIIADLLDDGMIREQGRKAGTRGLPAVQYALNPQGGYALGLEIRPDAVLAVLLDLAGNVLWSSRETLGQLGRALITDTVLVLKAAALKAVPAAGARLLGAGIVMPGPFGSTGLRNSGSELSGFDDIDPREWFSARLGLPVFVENDANAAAMAERVSGAAQGLRSFAYLYFGTGLGLALVEQGTLVTGAHGNAGEIGYIPVACAGTVQELETAVSRLAAQRWLAGQGIAARTADDLEALYREGTPALTDWLDRAAEPLGAAISIIENIADPEAIILGGAMPDRLLDHLIKATALPDRSVSNRPDRSHPRLMRGTAGRRAATLGAAALVINQTFTPRIAVAH